MATLTKTPEVTETVVVKKAGVLLELSHDEADNLAKLLRGGVGMSTLTAFGIVGIMSLLKAEGYGEMPSGQWRNWSQTSQWTGPSQ